MARGTFHIHPHLCLVVHRETDASTFQNTQANTKLPERGSRLEIFRPGTCYAQVPGRSCRSLQRLCGRQAALRRAGAFRVARALRAGLRRALPERLAVDFFVARLVAFFFAILAMSLLSLFPGGFSAQFESTITRARKGMGQSLTAR